MYEVMPFRGPGNFRGLEVIDTYAQSMAPLWLGQGTPEEIVPEVTQKIQEILDKPPVS
jgi:hypothetical protein